MLNIIKGNFLQLRLKIHTWALGQKQVAKTVNGGKTARENKIELTFNFMIGLLLRIQ